MLGRDRVALGKGELRLEERLCLGRESCSEDGRADAWRRESCAWERQNCTWWVGEEFAHEKWSTAPGDGKSKVSLGLRDSGNSV